MAGAVPVAPIIMIMIPLPMPTAMAMSAMIRPMTAADSPASDSAAAGTTIIIIPVTGCGCTTIIATAIRCGRYLGYWGGRRAWWKHRGDRGGHWNGGKSHGQHHEARPPRPNRPDRPDRPNRPGKWNGHDRDHDGPRGPAPRPGGGAGHPQIGRASCRERVCQYV